MISILSSSKRLSASSAPARAATARPAAPIDAWAEPLPLPEVVDDDSDTAWALWNAAVRGQPSFDADTVPMGLMPA